MHKFWIPSHVLLIKKNLKKSSTIGEDLTAEWGLYIFSAPIFQWKVEKSERRLALKEEEGKKEKY